MQDTTVDIKTVEAYWSKKPCNIAHSTKEVGTLEYFKEVYARKFFVEEHISEFARFGDWDKKNVLEIGTGLGCTAIHFAKAGANVTGVELSEKSLELCKKAFEVYGLKANLYQCNAEQLDYFFYTNGINTKYDLIFSFGVIHHSPRPYRIMQNIYELADTNTEIRIMVYAKYSFKGFYFYLTQGWKFGFNYNACIRYNAEAQSGCPIAFTYTAKGIKELCKDFKIVSIKKDHIFPYKIKDYIQHKYTKVWYFRYMPKWVFDKLSLALGWHYLVTLKKK
jgi:SAM-dependent methyltransferase